MMKLFLASHGHFASGLKSSLNILCGNSDKVTVFDAYVDDRNVKDVMEEFFKTVQEEDQVVMLSDLYGGSVNQAMFLFLDRPNTMLVAGVNLALVLELAVRESVSEEELEDLVNQSREMLRVVKNEEKSTSSEDDFF